MLHAVVGLVACATLLLAIFFLTSVVFGGGVD